MVETNVFALATVIKNAGGNPGDITQAIWDAGYRRPEMSVNIEVHKTLEIISGLEGADIPWENWPKDHSGILQCELNEWVEEATQGNKCNVVQLAKLLIDDLHYCLVGGK